MSPRRRRRVRTCEVCLLSLLLAFLLGGLGCSGGEEGPDKSGEGESCSVAADCQQPFVCRDGVCTDGSSGDVGVEDGGDTGTSLTSEDYYISYLVTDRANPQEPGELKVYSTADQTHTVVNDPDAVDCSSECWLTRDMQHFVYTESAGGSMVDVMVAGVGENFEAAGEGTALVEEVTDVEMQGNHVSFMDGSVQGGGTVFTREVSAEGDGQAQSVGDVGGSDDWVVDPVNDAGLLFVVGESNSTLDVEIGAATDRQDVSSFQIDGANFQEESGAFFGGAVPAAFSRDGRVGAFVTQEAPNDGAYCTRDNEQNAWSTSDCDTDLYYKCGNDQRCTRLEVVLHTVDMQNAEELGENCDAAEECSPYHECYIPAADRSDEAMCVPGRTVLGVPPTTQGPERETPGCRITSEDDSIDFTSVNGPLSFDADKNIYMVGQRQRSVPDASRYSCPGDYDTDTSQIVRVDPRDREYDVLGGFGPEESYSADACAGGAEDPEELEGCEVFVDSAVISPGGNELAYAGTHPSTQSTGQADSNLSLWHMLWDRSERWFARDESTGTSAQVSSIHVHPADD